MVLSERAESILIVIGIIMMIITMTFTLQLYIEINQSYGFDFKECIKEFEYDVCDILFPAPLQGASLKFNGTLIPFP